MLTNKSHVSLYIGMTNNLERRLSEHQHGHAAGFAKRYNVGKLVYQEIYTDPDSAIARETQLKGWKRDKKNQLIESVNPEWKDLSADWYMTNKV